MGMSKEEFKNHVISDMEKKKQAEIQKAKDKDRDYLEYVSKLHIRIKKVTKAMREKRHG